VEDRIINGEWFILKRVLVLLVILVLIISGCNNSLANNNIYKIYEGHGEKWSTELIIKDNLEDNRYMNATFKMKYLGDLSELSNVRDLNWKYRILHKEVVSEIEDSEELVTDNNRSNNGELAITGGEGIVFEDSNPDKKEFLSEEHYLNKELIKNAKEYIEIAIEQDGKQEKFLVFPVNQNGQTYGPMGFVNTPGNEPDLISAVGEDAKEGYLKKQDMFGEQPNNPEEAMAYMERIEKEKAKGHKYIPLYSSDGETIIGKYKVW